MTTTSNLFDAHEVAEFAELLRDWPNCIWGDDEQQLGVSPFLSFYFLYNDAQHQQTCLKLIKIKERFEKLLGESPFKVATHPTSERPHPYGSKRIPDLREFVKKRTADDHFLFRVSDAQNYRSSPATAGEFWKIPAYRTNPKREDAVSTYSSVQLYYRWSWWLEHQERWRQFVLQTIDLLQPEQVYSGFAMASPLELGTRSEVAVWERSLTPLFYGLDIDSPFGQHSSLTLGIRPPTWAFLLSDTWRQRLGLSRQAVLEALQHPGIRTAELDCGLWIELGKQPELYPVELGQPELPVILNRLLKPIRNQDLPLLDFGEWNGDPNERFSMTDSRRWLQRFDDDSDWAAAPSPAGSP